MGNNIINSVFNVDCIDFMKKNKFTCNHVITDIPYNVVSRETGGIRKFDKANADILTFNLAAFCDLIKSVVTENIFIFCSTEQITELAKNLEEDFIVKLAIWEKTNPSPVNGQYFWLSGIECCIVASKQEIKDIDLIFTTPAGRSKEHPTEKPPKLLDQIITKFTEENDIIYDPCAGSGSHIISAIRNKRRFIGNEIFNEYYNLIIKKIEIEKL